MEKKKNKEHRIFRWLLFALAAAAIILLSLLNGFRTKTEWSAETYGTTRNKKLAIEEDKEYKISFRIRHDGFQGIRFRLTKKIQEFSRESLRFVLWDQETDSVVDSYTMYLRDIVNQAEVFAPLYYEDSADKQVTVQITGNNIREIPELYVSKNCDLKSELYVNDQLQEDYYLVFSANYKIIQNINYQALLRGGLYLLLLLLIGILPTILKKGDASRKEQTEKVRHLLPDFPVTHRKWCQLFVISFIYLSAAVFFYETCIEDYVQKRRDKDIVEDDPEYERELHITSDTGRIEQSFYSKKSMLSMISFLASRERTDSAARLHVQVFDADRNTCFHDGYIDVDNIPTERGYVNIFLSKEYTYSRYEVVWVVLTAEDFGDAELILYTGKPTTEVSAYKDGALIGTAPVLKVSYANYDYLAVLYRNFAILLYVFLLMCWALFGVFQISAERAFVPVALFLGLLYMLIIPVYSVPDEYSHIDTAYIISNRMLGIDAPEEYWGYDYKRAEDVETEEYLTYYTTLADYRRLYAELFKPAENKTLVMVSCKNVMSNAGLFFYLPAAIGLTIARLLGCGTLTMFLFGRFINLLVYVLACSYAIRKLPGFKWLFMVYATTPIALQEAASFSYDAMVNAVALLFIAMCFFYAVQDSPKWIDHILLAFSLLQLATVKGGTYLPICLLIWIIPIERAWAFSRRIGFYICTMVLAAAAFLQNNIIRVFSGFLNPAGTSINPFTGTELYTMSYLKHHPFKAVSLFVATVFEQGSRVIYEFFGGKMGSLYNLQMPWLYILLFIGLFYVVCRNDERQSILQKTRSILGAIIITFLSVGLICLSMLLGDTATKYNNITGIQGRYFIPCVFVLMIAVLCLRPVRTDGSRTKPFSAVMWYFTTQAIFLLNIVLIVKNSLS